MKLMLVYIQMYIFSYTWKSNQNVLLSTGFIFFYFISSKPTQQVIVGCASGGLQSLANECTKQEQFMVGQTLQNMMACYQPVCTGQPRVGPGRAPSACLQNFEKEMSQCSADNMGAPLNDIMILLTRGQVPEGQDIKTLNKTICE